MTDKQEFETVFRRHYDGMYQLALRLLGDEAESKDVVSDVFAQLLHSPDFGNASPKIPCEVEEGLDGLLLLSQEQSFR